MLHDLDTKALVIWVCAREVAVREQSGGRVATDELELFVVAHFERLLRGCGARSEGRTIGFDRSNTGVWKAAPIRRRRCVDVVDLELWC